jgi:hypothetical protein
MRLSTRLIFIFLCFACLTAKKIKDEDFSEFDDFDQDEFVIGMFRNSFRLLFFLNFFF